MEDEELAQLQVAGVSTRSFENRVVENQISSILISFGHMPQEFSLKVREESQFSVLMKKEVISNGPKKVALKGALLLNRLLNFCPIGECRYLIVITHIIWYI
jgi:hypothetical protein